MKTIGMKEEVESYILSNFDTKILSCKPEIEIDDIGIKAVIWNIKTSTEGNWWVVTSDRFPMNLYPQFEYYFGTDEVFSFHLGLMTRLAEDYETGHKNELKNITFGTELLNELSRKLTLIAEKVDSVEELEEIQGIGVMCRETLILLGNYIFEVEFLDGEDEPKRSDFKQKAFYFLQKAISGKENKELRQSTRNMTNSAWDYANKITHSTTATVHDASIAYTLCVATVSVYEKLLSKYYDPISHIKCMKCGSKKIELYEEKEILYGKCMNCCFIIEFVEEEGENFA